MQGQNLPELGLWGQQVQAQLQVCRPGMEDETPHSPSSCRETLATTSTAQPGWGES